ncbi:MAG TPA: N-acetylglucosamine-6-phosphate deacetylase [Thermotogota bacterium]|nr:N-acetylglucosamine-6-phosphate deacetylase [Thermotogota bacterium]HPJ88406.1 N-acetylglucosamine-6-phosphate deacetylase [Thermotogota bacterium]HPR95427.1 N-acetylglucosamine-6-phosphate deacetylase [Thermotogota bacterium]
MKIQDINVFTPYTVIENAVVEFDETIHALYKNNTEIPSEVTRTLVPGFVDTHIHGCVGEDFSNPSFEAFKKMEDFLFTRGVTSVLATTLSLPFDRVRKTVELAGEYMAQNPDTSISGVHLEGPFINLEKKGAQNPDFIKSPSDEEIEYICKNADIVKVITLAPEVVEEAQIKQLKAAGITVSIGHTCTDYRGAMNGLNAGASRFTHLFNAMNGIHHRDVNPVGAALLSDAHVELICDLIHLSKEAIRLVFRMKESNRIIFISDAMEATGLKPGRYDLGGLNVIVSDNAARLEDGTLAGSVLKLDEALRNVVLECGLPFGRVIPCVTATPAESSGLSSGFLDIGKKADMVLLDQAYQVIRTYKNGKIVYER